MDFTYADIAQMDDKQVSALNNKLIKRFITIQVIKTSVIVAAVVGSQLLAKKLDDKSDNQE